MKITFESTLVATLSRGVQPYYGVEMNRGMEVYCLDDDNKTAFRVTLFYSVNDPYDDRQPRIDPLVVEFELNEFERPVPDNESKLKELLMVTSQEDLVVLANMMDRIGYPYFLSHMAEELDWEDPLGYY